MEAFRQGLDTKNPPIPHFRRRGGETEDVQIELHTGNVRANVGEIADSGGEKGIDDSYDHKNCSFELNEWEAYSRS